MGFLSEIHALKIDLYLHQQGLDTTTPAGKAMFQMMGVFAEFERAVFRNVYGLACAAPRQRASAWDVRASTARPRRLSARLWRPVWGFV